ncbi:hypothetical protein [Paenibacillus eucommiae]|uniref:TniQ family protein n=1 Tax=Paenibacillus eucommiae TaxID=1355755 RepID=A0ABS4IUE3_9BACL|nr:hypothetical protein [Paenibacillus eucommiae]MBP1991194.1 hypothetical protein [Paenibacillus eucommiae]
MFITWNENWISRYESVWSILEKAKYVNKVNTKQLLTYLGYPTQTKDLLNFGILNNNHITNTFGICLYSHTQNSIEEMTKFLPKNIEKSMLVRNKLHYCSECLRYGYHSLLHQIKLFYYCPYHMSPLMNTCQSCGDSILFEPSLSQQESGFICKCGGLISNIKLNHFNNWIFKQDISGAELKEWVNLKIDENNRIAHMYITNNILLDNKNIRSMFLEVSRGVNPFANKQVSLLQFRPIKSDLNNTQNLHDEIYESIRQTVKSVEKYLIHRVIVKHQKCIERVVTDKGKSNDTCIYAVTLLNWKRSLLDIDLVQREMGPAGKNKLKKFDILVHIFTNEIHKLLDYSIKYLQKASLKNCNFTAALKWIVNHFIVMIALTSFFDILRYVNSNIEKIKVNRNILTNLPKEIFTVPCVFYHFPDDLIKDNIEIYWFKNKKTTAAKAYKHAYCNWMQ